jgi:hypothetical protein
VACVVVEKENISTTIKEKPVMRKVRKTLSIVILAFAILGILVVSVHAKKPSPRPEPTVTVSGGIEGEGDPAMIRITFADSSFEDVYPQNSSFISNPDYPPSLKIFIGTPATTKELRYYYCTHNSHADSDDLICDDPTHSPDYYYCLLIGGGISKKKGRPFDHVVFPVDSPWNISWKKDNSIVASGTLNTETAYDLVQ